MKTRTSSSWAVLAVCFSVSLALAAPATAAAEPRASSASGTFVNS
jgi:hypothetical protein